MGIIAKFKERSRQMSEATLYAREHARDFKRSLTQDYHELFLSSRLATICAVVAIGLGPLFALDIGNMKLMFSHVISGGLLLAYPILAKRSQIIRLSGVHYYDFLCAIGMLETVFMALCMKEVSRELMLANDYLPFNLFLFSFLGLSANRRYLFIRNLLFFSINWLLFYAVDPQLVLFGQETLRHVGQALTLHAAGIVTAIFICEGQKYKFVIKRQQEYVVSLLDSIQQGVARVNYKLCIEKGYSKHMHVLFPERTNFEGMSVMELIFPGVQNAEHASMLRETISACMGEREIAYTLNGHHLPGEVLHPSGKTLAISWTPIYLYGTIRGFQLGITDVSESRKLERRAGEARHRYERIAMILPLLGDRRGHLLDFMSNFLVKLGVLQLGKPLSHWTSAEKEQSLGVLHTLKGEARALGLEAISSSLHRMEDEIKAEAAAHLLRSFEEMRTEATELSQLATRLGHLDDENARKIRFIDIVGEYIDMVENSFKKAGLPQPRFEIIDDVGTFDTDPTLQAFFRDVLVHALTNAADHGFIMPFLAGKRTTKDYQGRHTPRFRLSFHTSERGLRLLIDDSGFGLDWKGIDELCQKHKFQPEAGRPTTDVLWRQGVSTSEVKTHSTGQGIGASVIYMRVQERGGECTLMDSPILSGVRLAIEIPLETVPLLLISA